MFKQRGCYSIGKKIEIGVKIFSDIYFVLNAEDKERIYNYIEEFRDIVVLESSKNNKMNSCTTLPARIIFCTVVIKPIVLT